MIIISALAVLIGGFVGGCARFTFTRILPSPTCTFAANITGAALAGVAYGYATHTQAPEYFLPLLAAGLAGGLSTWSTMAKELGEMIKAKRWWRLARYLFWTIGIGIAVAWRGAWVGSLLA
ncbi:fluoride efflux transporter FluC [Corynebacterium minutissimum]|uniref:fluoride efflux transporter FluC n=1 Tax=Corynebacterium minutissimum TaxID=38301 RepID=UPI001EF30D47|nr:CrcB family protein [Corynebacterium minutissimum]MCG7228717.1 CrcB family protein [Corynebacterium minutissimum]MCG7237834.1 CrcB family protein [Corynebacterium minutissimum]